MDINVDEFWRDKIKHKLLILNQKLDNKCHLDWAEIEILKLLIEVKLEILNLNAFPDLSIQMDYKLEQILKQEISNLIIDEDGDTKEDIEKARQFLKIIPKFELEWPSNKIDIKDID